jgi:hypothetical protein
LILELSDTLKKTCREGIGYFVRKMDKMASRVGETDGNGPAEVALVYQRD